MAHDIDTVFRDNVIKGDIHSGAHWPDKPEIRAMLKQIQSSGGQAVTRNTVAALNAVTPPNENYMGIVLNGSGAGLYSREAGAWVFGRGFPDTFAKVTLSGTGTAQSGVVSTGVSPASIEVFFAKVATPNTGPLTLSISGGPARQVINLAGNSLSTGEWTGMVMFYLNDANQYQLLLDARAAASAAASATLAQSERIASEAARDAAEGAAETVVVARYNSKAGLEAATVSVAVQSVELTGYAFAGDGGGQMLVRVASEPAHGGIRSTDRFLPNGTTNPTNGGWWQISESAYDAKQFGVTGTNDHQAIMRAAAALNAKGGGILEIPPGIYDIGTGGVHLVGMSNIHIRGAGGKSSHLRKNPAIGANIAGIVFQSCTNCSVDGVYVDNNGQAGNGIAVVPANASNGTGAQSQGIHVQNCTVDMRPDYHNYGIWFFKVLEFSAVNNDINGKSSTPWLNKEMEGIECFGSWYGVVSGNRIRNLSGNAMSLFSEPSIEAPFKNIVYTDNSITDCFGFVWATASFSGDKLSSMDNISICGNRGDRIFQRGVSLAIMTVAGVTAYAPLMRNVDISDNQIIFATKANGVVASDIAAFGFNAGLNTGEAADASKFRLRNVTHHDNDYFGLDTGAATLVSVSNVHNLKSYDNQYSRSSDDAVGIIQAYVQNAEDCSFLRETFTRSQNYGMLAGGGCPRLVVEDCKFINIDQSGAGSPVISLDATLSSDGLRIKNNTAFKFTGGALATASFIAASASAGVSNYEVSGNRLGDSSGTMGAELTGIGAFGANGNRGSHTMAGGATSFTINTNRCTQDAMVSVIQENGPPVDLTVKPNAGSFTVTLGTAADDAVFRWRIL